MIPFSVFLPEELHHRMKDLARQRKAGSVVREALEMFFDGGTAYRAGYNKAVADAAKIIYNSKEAQMIAVNRRDLGAVLADQIDTLKLR